MAKAESGGCPGLGVTIYSKGDTVPSRLPDQEIAQLHPTDSKRLLSLDCDAAFIVVNEHVLLGCQHCQEALSRAFGLPNFWWNEYRLNSHGYFGCEDIVDEQGVLSGLKTWSRFLVKQVVEDSNGILDYEWQSVDIYTSWRASNGETVILAFDPQPQVRKRLRGQLAGWITAEHLGNPFWMYVPVLEEVLHLQEQAVWGIRQMVRTTEKNRTLLQKPQPDYIRLHEIARHAIHVSESLSTGNCNFDSILAHRDRVAGLIAREYGTRLEVHASDWVHNRLLFLQNLLRSSHGRSISNKERLQNEIQLAFNVVTQYDTRISVKIARATREDSASMRTIAFVTLAFLPATFICAIFSMSFFDFDSSTNEWAVSSEFWRYWVVAIPVTGFTTASWYFWNKRITSNEEVDGWN